MTASPPGSSDAPAWDGLAAPELVGLPVGPSDWPFLGVVLADGDRACGFAVLNNPTTAITEGPVDGSSIRIGGRVHGLRMLSEEDGLCRWAVGPPADLTPDQRPPLRTIDGASACVVLQVDDLFPSVVVSSGTVTADADSGRRRVSGFAYSENRTARGSPVITDRGIVGLAGSTGTNASVDLADAPHARLEELWRVMPESAAVPLPFSPGAGAILDEAVALHSWRTNPTPAAASLVLCGAAVEAARRDDGTVLSTFVSRFGPAPELVARLGLQVRDRTLRSEYAAGSFGAPLIALVTRAAALAIELGSPGIHARHVLAAAAADDASLTPTLLTALGTTAADLRRSLRDVIDDTSPEDDSAVWDTFLTSTVSPIDLEGGTSADFVDPARPIPLERDTLGMAVYVRMIASLLAGRQTPQPLSVGLFGAWGSGKSFFMGMLRHEIARLSKESPATHCGQIAQVSFNAWHYSDTDLWASLGDEIFRQLLRPELVGRTDERRELEQQRQRLAEELETQRAARAELLVARERAIKETAEARRRLAAARRRSAEQRVGLLRAAKGSPALRGHLDDAFRRLGVGDEIEQAGALADALGESGGEIERLAAMTRDRRTRWFVVAALLVLAAAAIVAFFAPQIAAALGVAGISSLLATAVAVAGWARSGLQKLRIVAEELQAADAQEREAASLPDLEAYREAKARERGTEAQLATVTRRTEQIEHDLEELRPDAQLFRFLIERAESPDYQGRLGLISIVRRDLDQLSLLMKEWHDHPVEGRTPIDRIVLYIDDLDRCEPEQVVEVLQAVHLLLALDLFTVVVGVDPRWMVRSLRARYPATLGSGGTDGPSDGGVTPEDYLEKIFNIPFVLPRMDARAFGQFVSAVVDSPPPGDPIVAVEPEPEPESEPEPEPQPAEAAEGVTTRPEDVSRTTDVSMVPDEAAGSPAGSRLQPAAIEIEPQSALASDATATTRVVEPLKLSDEERALLTAVGALLETPREGTRVLNLYRMLRATRDLSRSREFLGNDTRPGEYQAVIVLLAMLTAHPHLMGALLDHPPGTDRDDPEPPRGGILHWPETSTWKDVVDGIAVAPGAAANRISVIRPEAAAEWNRLSAGLRPTLAFVTLPDLQAVQEWAPKVARFSFLLLPVAGQHER
ncbi:P-loop NTPase fold protein [Microbacterium sp. B35-30]|uniref:P-loop NTPase fold protein n=1 Tax=Microbacterium sp. B35-30 TaxID=1962642 RepID=UPI0013D63718|nr:P-loop NTPase fold protein [Microbacterium sp. B35-30]KAF2415974.1 hypothetical protein B2K11_17680 [Microbacterium sp. B35-30]